MATAQEVVKRGYLTKSPPARQALAKWKRRWCMLLDSHLVYPLAPRYVRLEYFEDEESQLAGKDPKGVIDLKDCQSAKKTSNMKNHKNVFDIVTADRVYHMSADSAAEKQEWVEALQAILFSDDDAMVARAHLYNTRQMGPSVGNTSLSPVRHQRSSVRSVSPVPNRRAVESQQSQLTMGQRNYDYESPVPHHGGKNGNVYTPGPVKVDEQSPRRHRSSISERVRAAIQIDHSHEVPSTKPRSKFGDKERPRSFTTSSPSSSPSSGAKKLNRAVSAHVGPMGDYDMAAPRRESESDEEETGGPISIRPQESSGKAKTLAKSVSAESESDEEASGPTSIIAQEPSHSEIRSDPLTHAHVPTVSAVAQRFSLQADIDPRERNPDYHNLTYPEDAPEGAVTAKGREKVGDKFHDYLNLDYSDAQQASGKPVAPNYQNLDFSDKDKVRDYQNVGYSDGSGPVHPPRLAPKIRKGVGSDQEDFLVMSFPAAGSKTGKGWGEDQYEQLPSHSHLSGIAGTTSYPSVGMDLQRIGTSKGPSASLRCDLARSKPQFEHPDYDIAARHVGAGIDVARLKSPFGHADYDIAAPRVGSTVGISRSKSEHADYDIAAPRVGPTVDISRSKLPSEHPDYDIAAPRVGPTVEISRSKSPSEHSDYDFAAPHVGAVPRHTQYDYVAPKPRKLGTGDPVSSSLPSVSAVPVPRHAQYDYVQPKPRPRKDIGSRPHSAVMPEPEPPHHRRGNYDYVTPGARPAVAPRSRNNDAAKVPPGFSDYYEAAPRQKSFARSPEVDGYYELTPQVAAPQVDGDYDIVGFHGAKK